MKAPILLQIMPVTSDEPKILKKGLNDLIRRLDESFRYLRSDVQTLDSTTYIDWTNATDNLLTLGTGTFGELILTTDLAIAYGGTGQSTAQAAIDALSAVSGATNEHVLTKDTATGKAIWKVAAGGGVTDHGALTGLVDDDHPQYIKDAEFTQNSGFLVGTGAGTYQEETGATLRTSIGVGTGDSPTLAGLTITGNSVFGLNSSVFQPTTDSTTFFQVKNAAGGTPILNVDSTNERVGIGTNSPEETLEVVGGDDNAASMKITGNALTTGLGARNFSGGLAIYGSTIAGIILRAGASGGLVYQFEVGEDHMQAIPGANTNLHFFEDATSGKNPNIRIYGYPTGGALDYGVFRIDATTNNFLIKSNRSGSHVELRPNMNVGIKETAPETSLEITDATPYLTLHNSTHENSDGGRESRINFKGEQSGGWETTLARIEVGHDGAADDEKGKVVISVNDGGDGNTPTQALEIGSDLLATFTGGAKITKAAYFTAQQTTTGDGTTTINWGLGNKFYFTFGAQNDTFTFTAPGGPCNLLLVLKQDGTGSRTITWPATVLWPAGTAPTLSTGANDVDIVSFYYDGTNYFGNTSKDFS